MLTLSAPAWLALAAAALLVGISKTAVPGAATISVALFAAVLPARESTGALLLLLILGDVFAVWMYRAYADWRTLRALVPPVVVGVVAGTAFLALSGDTVVRRTIAVILLVLIAQTAVGRAVGARRRRVPTATTPVTTPPSSHPPASQDDGGGRRRLQTGAYGVLGGFTTMVANAGGPVMSLYFLASRFSVNQFLGTAAWFFAAVNVLKVPFSVSLGLIHLDTLRLDLLLAPAVVLGAVIGRRAARRISQTLFDRLVIVLTVVSAAYLLV